MHSHIKTMASLQSRTQGIVGQIFVVASFNSLIIFIDKGLT